MAFHYPRELSLSISVAVVVASVCLVGCFGLGTRAGCNGEAETNGRARCAGLRVGITPRGVHADSTNVLKAGRD